MEYSSKDLKGIAYHLALAEFKKHYEKAKTRERKIAMKKAIEDLEELLRELNGK